MTIKKKKTTTTSVKKHIHKHVKLAVVPHKANQFRPHVIRRQGIVLMVAFAMLLQGVYNGFTAGNVLGLESSITSQDLLSATNAARANEGLSELTINSELSKAAELKVQDMFKQQYWAHTAPDGTTPWHWFGEVGYAYADAGENLAKNFTTSDSVIAAWLQSPTHRANTLKATYSDVGFAIMDGTLENQRSTIIVALYGAPAVQAVQGTTADLSPTGASLNVVSQFGVGLLSLTPAAVGSIVLLLVGANIALIAHLYRKKLPANLRRTWYRHHGVYKTAGFLCLAFLIILMYGSGTQI